MSAPNKFYYKGTETATFKTKHKRSSEIASRITAQEAAYNANNPVVTNYTSLLSDGIKAAIAASADSAWEAEEVRVASEARTTRRRRIAAKAKK
jgi:hypothetical protein